MSVLVGSVWVVVECVVRGVIDRERGETSGMGDVDVGIEGCGEGEE